jgi:hypothetical protein
MDIEKANATATERMMEARPVLVGLGKAREVVPGMRENLLLHAGPPITWARASGPMRGAITGALIFEGKAKDMAEAQALVESGEIELEPCHHHQAVGPMAGVTSPSMSVYILENKTHGNRSYSNLNEGYGKVLRYGAYSDEVLNRLRWMEEVMGPVLADAIEAAVHRQGRAQARGRRRHPESPGRQCLERAQPGDGRLQGDGRRRPRR